VAGDGAFPLPGPRPPFLFAIFGGAVGAEGGDFQDLLLEVEVGQPEAAADEAAVPEEPLDLAGGGIGGDVEILGGASAT